MARIVENLKDVIGKNGERELWIQYLAHDHFRPSDTISFNKAKKHIDYMEKNYPGEITIIMKEWDNRSAQNVIKRMEKAPWYRQFIFRLFAL